MWCTFICKLPLICCVCYYWRYIAFTYITNTTFMFCFPLRPSVFGFPTAKTGWMTCTIAILTLSRFWPCWPWKHDITQPPAYNSCIMQEGQQSLVGHSLISIWLAYDDLHLPQLSNLVVVSCIKLCSKLVQFKSVLEFRIVSNPMICVLLINASACTLYINIAVSLDIQIDSWYRTVVDATPDAMVSYNGQRKAPEPAD